MRFTSFVLGVCAVLSVVSAEGASPAPLSIQEFSRSNSTVRLSWTPLPAIESYEVLSASSPVDAFERQLQGVFNNFTWSGNSDAGAGFYKLVAQPLSDEALYAANALNRIAYGPTPDELDRILTGANPTGAQGFINEQLAPELIQETLDTDPPISGWVFNTVSGPIESARLYIYLDGPGSVLIDDIKLVAGAEPGVGANLLQNGGFESALSPRWVATANFTNSLQVTGGAKEGTRMLQLTATAAGSGNGNALYQNFSGVQAGQVYTLSYWHFTTNLNRTLTIRCSGPTSLRSEHAVSPARPPVAQIHSELLSRNVNLAGLRSWFVQHAVYSQRQLLEVMSQFWENHFVTEHSKTVDYFDRYYDDFDQIDRIAADLEFRELTRWRDTMMKPTGTFRDLLRISAESPAQIIYLDTVDSRGDGRYIANENYARELLELYTFGVDNGYDQTDIVTMSRAWTGWTVRLKDEVNINNPFAPQTTNILDTTITNLAQLGAISNLVGVWTLHFRNSRHATAAKTIFPGKRVPARFGAPWANRLYELRLPARSGDPGMQDGYDVINHLSDQPFTQEYISVKLCRLLVHEDFHHGEYDYRDPNLSEEGKLVHKCMQAWENGSPKGQLRQVLRVILESDLFKKQPGSMQKIKTPIEFCASA
ncbi:MAG: DUF1800 family protein, partial [Verrucomicrobia bacterium]|nr:DUF1800 family protein [Verrucomicrobiota bacterium]